MADDRESFAGLMQGIRDGSEEAARLLLEKYGPHILRVVRRQMHERMRSKFDSADFTQAVWASFFALQPGRLNFDRPEALVAFLTRLAQNKVIDELRVRFQTQKLNLNRENSLDGSAAHAAALVPAAQPTPSQVAMAKECWHQLLDGLPSHHQRILVLLLQGHTHQEIAGQLGVNERTIRRVIQKVFAGDETHDESEHYAGTQEAVADTAAQ